MRRRSMSMVLSSFFALAAGCGHSDSDYNARVREAQSLRDQLHSMQQERDRIQQQLTDLHTQNDAMMLRLRALGENVSATQSELDAARQREADLRRSQALEQSRLATFRQMLERFHAMINAGQLSVRIVRGQMVIQLPAGILFESGDARLRRAGQAVLRQVAGVLRQIPDRDFLVSGHTDNVALGHGERFHDNWELSAQRAVGVVRFLRENGLAPAHLGAAGYAENQPVDPNDSEEHRALNRRVEIVLMPSLGELPDLSALNDNTSTSGAPSSSASPAP